MSEDPHSVPKLKDIFSRLCSHGEVGNTKTLKSIKIKRFFQTHNILSQLSHGHWLDLTITDLCRSSPSGKVEFPQFLELMTLTANKLDLDHKGLFQYLIDSSTNTLINSRLTQEAGSPHKMTHYCPSEAEKVLAQVERPLNKIFDHFAKGKSQLTFEQLSHLLYEFDVFPGFLSKARLYQLFEAHATANTSIGHLVGKVSLDLGGFIRVLAEISGEAGSGLS